MRLAPGHSRLPSSGPEREALRAKGQFWTPGWIAESMVAYVLGGGSKHVFDPAVGGGAFLLAAKAVGAELGFSPELLGSELHEDVLADAREHGLSADDLAGVLITDFVLAPPARTFQAIVANPPYIRHHRLSAETKQQLQALSRSTLGHRIDQRAGYHVFFLIRALERLAPGGRLAFIMPADTCEGVFSGPLWEWITRSFGLDAVITFDHTASPFPGVDTNAIIFLIRNAPAESTSLVWARCRERGSALREWVSAGMPDVDRTDLLARRRSLPEALATGLSRSPLTESSEQERRLGQFARVLRGIATGANEFFFLTHPKARELLIPAEFLLPAVGRTRDVPTEILDAVTLQDLESSGRPSLLLSLDGRAVSQFPPPIRDYIKYGEGLGLSQRALIKSRRPWYKMEVRRPPPFLFAYLGRRNARFIRNRVDAVPLTGFLCVYPRFDDPLFIERLWLVLQHPTVVANLHRVGKSYGGGAIKVEPRALERLPLPLSVLQEFSVDRPPAVEQLACL